MPAAVLLLRRISVWRQSLRSKTFWSLLPFGLCNDTVDLPVDTITRRPPSLRN
jgi:hypothetical protein